MANNVPIKIACYTCVTGNYEKPQMVSDQNTNVSFFFFGNQYFDLPYPWKLVPLPLTLRLNNQDLNRLVKIQPHLFNELENFDYLIYVDGNVEIIGNLNEFIQEIELEQNNNSIGLFQHPLRKSVFEEIIACAWFGHQHLLHLLKHFFYLKKNKFTDQVGLFECGVFVWNMNNYNKDFTKKWWDIYYNYAKRDQLALPIALELINVKYKNLGFSKFRNSSTYFKLKPHLKKTSIKKLVYRALNAPLWLTSLNKIRNSKIEK